MITLQQSKPSAPPGAPDDPPRQIGRYRLYGEIAHGGMATVHFGRLVGPVGFARMVAIKRLHAQFAKDPGFVAMFLDEARLAARIHHPNVVATLDVVTTNGELFLVMDYVHGETLSRLLRGDFRPPRVIAGIMAGVLHGLHAAHEARSERGRPLDIVHRDVSPQNILVGVDGVARVLDFGVAKASHRAHSTAQGTLKGKLRYMAPEQVRGDKVTRQTDVYAAGVVLYEALTGRRLYDQDELSAVIAKILLGDVPLPSLIDSSVSPEFDAIILRALARDPAARYVDAQAMALDLEEKIGLASSSQIAAWVRSFVQDALNLRAAKVAEIESDSMAMSGPPSARPNPTPTTDGDKTVTVIAPAPQSTSSVTRLPADKAPARTAALYTAVAGVLGMLAIAMFLVRSRTPALPSRAPVTLPTDPGAEPAPLIAPLMPNVVRVEGPPPTASVEPTSPALPRANARVTTAPGASGRGSSPPNASLPTNVRLPAPSPRPAVSVAVPPSTLPAPAAPSVGDGDDIYRRRK